MTPQDAEIIVAIAAIAAAADGNRGEAEQQGIADAAKRLGVTIDPALMLRVGEGAGDFNALASRLSDHEARVAAYDTAAAICHVDGPLNEKEQAFLAGLSKALGADNGSTEANATIGAAAAAVSGTRRDTPSDLDQFILDQAMLAGACELLPHRLAGMAIMPLQLHMVYSIGQRHGQQFDLGQAKDLIAVLGIGAAGHLMEGIVRGVLGGIGRGVLGGLLGGAAGVAAGTAVTFATTYALGHAAEQYYAQGRRLSTADLKALFARFQGDAQTVFPRVEGRIRDIASTTNLNSVLGNLRG